MNTARVAQKRLCVDKGDFTGDFAEFCVPSKKGSPVMRCGERGGAKTSLEKCSSSDFGRCF